MAALLEEGTLARLRPWPLLVAGTLLVAGCAAPPPPGPPAPPPPGGDALPAPPPAGGAFEVWLLDQADTHPDGGGTLLIYNGTALAADANAAPERVDLGGAALAFCRVATGSAPRRPHMLAFGAGDTHAVIAFVATGHVLFLDARSRAPAGCVDVGAQAHAAMPHPGGRFVLVANQNGKLLQRIITSYEANHYVLDDAATLNLTACTAPGGAPCEDPALRPDNAPICPVYDNDGRWAFVTLRGGGLFVVDASAQPMAIAAAYDRDTIHPNGCGGIQSGDTMYLTSGGGTAANPLEADVYAIDLAALPAGLTGANTPAPRRVLSQDDRDADLHGAALVGAWMWLADRHGNRILVLDAANGTLAGEYDIAGDASADPAPDLLAASPDGAWVFASLRGPSPLTGNAPAVNNSVGATPGLAVFRVLDGGRSGELAAIARLAPATGANLTDPHGLAVRPLR